MPRTENCWKQWSSWTRIDPNTLRGTVASTSIDKANMLNDFFFSCFNTVFPPLTPKHILHQSSSTEESLLCTEDEVLHLLRSLDDTKSSGISPTMLKHTAGASLTKSFTISLGQLPSQWKWSLTVPIQKNYFMGSPSCLIVTDCE